MQSDQQANDQSGQPQTRPKLVSSLRKRLKNYESDPKQYIRQNGSPYGPSYQQSKEDKKQTEDGVVYSKTDRSTVQARKNPLSPFLTVTPSKPVTQEKIDTLNAISSFAGDHPNLAVEIFAGYHEKGEHEGKQKFLRREIKNGFSLEKTEQLNEYRRSGKITDKQLSNQFNILWSLVGELKDQGLYHNDVNIWNIILDTETNKLVLTDWMEAAKRPLYSIDYDQEAIEDFKDHFVPRPVSRAQEDAVQSAFEQLGRRVGDSPTQPQYPSYNQPQLSGPVPDAQPTYGQSVPSTQLITAQSAATSSGQTRDREALETARGVVPSSDPQALTVATNPPHGTADPLQQSNVPAQKTAQSSSRTRKAFAALEKCPERAKAKINTQIDKFKNAFSRR